MEFSYFLYQFLPSYASYLGSNYGREPIDVPQNIFDLPDASLEQVIDAAAATLFHYTFGLAIPGMESETFLSTAILSDSVDVNNPTAVMSVLKNYGALKQGAGLVGEGLEITKQSLKEWCSDTFNRQADTLKTAISNAPAAAGAQAGALAINISKDIYQRTKDLAKLLANEDMSMNVDIDDSVEVDCANVNAFNTELGNVLYQLGLITNGTLIINPDDYVDPDLPDFNNLLGMEHQTLYVVYIRNKINHKILPYILVLGDAVNKGGDPIQAFIDHFNLVVDSETTLGQKRIIFRIRSYFANFGSGLTNLDKLYYGEFNRNKPLHHDEAGIETPFDGAGTDSAFINSFNSLLPMRNLTNAPEYLEQLYTLIGDGISINPFFDGMTDAQINDDDSYEIYVPVNNSQAGEHLVFAPTWDPNLKNKLILDEYDVATVNDDSASVDRDRDRTLALDPAGLDELMSAIPYPYPAAADFANILFPTVGVYPWDIPNDRTLTTVPLDIADAGENIADKFKDENLYIGTPDAKLVSATGVYGLFTIYKVSASNLSALGAQLWSASFVENFHPFKNDPSEALISLIGYPMNISAASGSSDIICGNNNCAPASGHIVSDLFQDHSMGSIVIPEKFGNFMDYSPYTKISLYLPFVGLVDLDTDEVMGATLRVDYRVELLTGTAIAKVTVVKGAMNAVLYQYSCNVGFTLPLSASDFSRTYTSLMTGAGTMALGAMSGNPALMAGGAAALATSVANAKPDINKTGGMSGNSGMCGNMNAYVVIDTAVPDKPGGYDKLKGVPANQLRQLGQMTGFVKLNEFQLNNISATDEEKAEIDRLLRSGVIV